MIHNELLLTDDDPVGSIVDVSEYYEPGTATDVEVEVVADDTDDPTVALSLDAGSSDSSDLELRVREQLDEVLDPRDTFTEKPQSVVDSGLVDGVSIESGDVTTTCYPRISYTGHVEDREE